MEKHVVVIYAHPDDESFGAAGTIMNFRKEGVPVTFLCGTLGEMGRNMGAPVFANRETLPKIREQELYEACDYLDIDVRLLGFRDKTIEYEDRQEVAKRVKKILEEIKPSLVITHYPDYAVHPDHNALGAGVIEAVRQMDVSERPVVWAQAIGHDFMDDLGRPDIVHDVRDIFEKKMTSILKHKSQAEGMLEKIDGTLQLTEAVINRHKERLGKEQFYIWSFDETSE